MTRSLALGGLAVTLGLCTLASAGCGTGSTRASAFSPRRYEASSRRVGPGRRFTPVPAGFAVAHAARVDGMSCQARSPVLTTAHVELFAQNHVVVLPAGIGVAPPLRRAGAYVRGGRCLYPLRTIEPTGLVEIAAPGEIAPGAAAATAAGRTAAGATAAGATAAGATHTLGELFALWGQTLTRRRVAGFSAAAPGQVAVFVNGSRWPGLPAAAPLTAHAQITIEVGPYVPPHTGYAFPALSSAAKAGLQ